MSRCLYLEYGAGCGCSECMSGYRESRPIRRPIRPQCSDPGPPTRIASLEARVAVADRLADWIEGRVEADHPEACAGRLCICQALTAYRASEVTNA